MTDHHQHSPAFSSYIDYIDGRIDSIHEIRHGSDTTIALPVSHADDQCPTLRGKLVRSNSQCDRLDHRLSELEMQTRCVVAVLKNRTLRDPNTPIEPIPMHRVGNTQTEPNLHLYPKNATELYALRTPRSPHQRQVLAHLIEFYDVPYHTWNSKNEGSCGFGCEASEVNPETTTCQAAISVEAAICQHAGRIVEYLERILGLNEKQFCSQSNR